MYRRLAAAVVGLAAVVASAGVAASPAQADVAPYGTVWYEGIIRSWAQGRCLDSNEAGEVYTIPCNFGEYQQWRVKIYYWHDNQWPAVFIQNVKTGRYLGLTGGEWGSPVNTIAEWGNWQSWILFPAYSGRWDAWRFSVGGDGLCLDANQPTDTTGMRPYANHDCGSNYQDWKMGY